MVTAAMKLKDACALEKSYEKPRHHIKKQRHYFVDKVHRVKAVVFPVVEKSMDVRVGPQRKLSTNELMFLNCGVGEDF